MWDVLQLWCDDLKFDPGRAFACWNCRRTLFVAVRVVLIGSSLEDSNFNHHGSCIQTQFTPHIYDVGTWHPSSSIYADAQTKTQDQLKSLQSGQTFAFRELSGSQAEQLPVSSACWEMLGKYWEHTVFPD